jgi:5'-deoxy-5'-methylthioadenosine phosphorylase
MKKIAVIGGSHFASLKNLVITHSTSVKTPYGEPSASLSYGILGNQEVVYLPRRGSNEPTPPHKINYRANIWALRDAGVQTVIATAAVASLIDEYRPGDLVIPDQLIDYTYGRENTFLGNESSVTHISFAEPYSETLRKNIISKATMLDYQLITHATYAITQGPRLETIAEVNRLAQDGCHIVGMTGMPEAALARELELDYACIALIVRKAADRQNLTATDERVTAKESWVENLVEAIILDAAE